MSLNYLVSVFIVVFVVIEVVVVIVVLKLYDDLILD